MEYLTVAYTTDAALLWQGVVEQYPHIVAVKQKSLQSCKLEMYHLITVEMWRIHQSLNSYCIAKEIITYVCR